MHVAYIGNFRPEHSTENYIAKTLEDMGHTVQRVQEDEFSRTGINLAQLELVLWTRTWPGYVEVADLLEFRRLGIPTVSLHYDLYVGIGREIAMEVDPFWKTDFVFSTDGDPTSEKIFKRLRINHFYLPAGIYKKEVKRGNFQQKYSCDVAFVGTVWNYHPEWPYRVKLVDFLQNTYGLKFRHFGQKGRPGVRGLELNDLFASAKVIIGDSLCKNFTHQNYWSDRLYETTGRGGFLIHPYINGIETQFRSPYEIITYPFGDFNYLKGLVDFYVKEEHIRQLVTDRAMKRVRTDHTDEKRMETMLEVISAARRNG